MNTEGLSFHGPRRHVLRGRWWDSGDDEVRAVVVLLHGHGEHYRRYEHVIETLVKEGMAVIAIDHLGHGKSTGQRGHVRAMEDYYFGVDQMIHQAKTQWEDTPVVLWCQSMGANIGLSYLLDRKPNVCGAVMTSPWLRLTGDTEPSAAKMKLARWMTRLCPPWPDRTKLDAAGLCHDPNVIERYRHDPLVHDRTSARAFHVLYHRGLRALGRAADQRVPLLLMHGGADPITDCRATEEFALSSGDNVCFKKWEGLRHEIHNELEKSEVLEFGLGWVNKCISLF